MSEQALRVAYKDMARSVTASGQYLPVLARALRRRRRFRAVAAAGLPAVAAGAVAGIAAVATSPEAEQVRPQPPVASSEVNLERRLTFKWEWRNAKDPTDGYQGELIRAAESHANFAGAALRRYEDLIVLYGKGDPPAEVAALLARAPEGIEARWVTVPYSLAELQHAGRRVADVVSGVVGITFSDDYTNVHISLQKMPDTRSDLQALYRRASEVTDVPVVFEKGSLGQILVLPGPVPRE